MGALARERAPWRSLAVGAAAVAVALVPGADVALELTRTGIASGELWRLGTAHFVHAGADHVLWDVVALAVIGVLWERGLGSRYWGVFIGAASCVAAGVLTLAPGLSIYCGLSGVLSGLFVAGAMAAARLEYLDGRPWTARLFQGAVLLCLAKIGFEATTGLTLFANTASAGCSPVPLAHALGALGGIAGLGWPSPVPPAPSVSLPRPQEARLMCVPRQSHWSAV